MQNKDEFDSPGFRETIGSLFRIMDRRDRLEPRRPVWALAIVGSLMIFLGSVLWYSYPRPGQPAAEGVVPIVRADAGPLKVIPADPGGMDIPHRDSTVFETLRASREGDAGTRQVENLLGEPEEPLDRDEMFAGVRAELTVEGREVISAPEEKPIDMAAVLPSAVDPQDENDAPKVVAQAPAALPSAVTAPAAESQVKVAAAPVPAGKPVKPAVSEVPAQVAATDTVAEEISRTEPAAGVETFESGQGWFVQFGSMRTDQAAQTAWKDLQKSLSALAPLNHRVERADLGAKGVYYRLQSGPYAENRAREICAAVQAQRPGGCLVVKN